MDSCNFKCLENKCGQCLYDDPQIGWYYQVKYPEFFWWRFNNLPEKKRPKVLTPNSMDRFYKEPLIDFPENVGRRRY